MSPVADQLIAYNAQDVEAFVACYTEDVLIEDATGSLISKGREAMRTNYARMFAAHPHNHAQILHTISVGDYVVEHERITGRGPEPIFAVAIYRITGDLISHVRFLK